MMVVHSISLCLLNLIYFIVITTEINIGRGDIVTIKYKKSSGNTQILSSPQYRHQGCMNSDTVFNYTLTNTDQSGIVRIVFTHCDIHSNSYLKIYDGTLHQSHQVVRDWKYDKKHLVYQSSDQSLFLVFKSGSNDTNCDEYIGWRAVVSFVSGLKHISRRNVNDSPSSTETETILNEKWDSNEESEEKDEKNLNKFYIGMFVLVPGTVFLSACCTMALMKVQISLKEIILSILKCILYPFRILVVKILRWFGYVRNNSEEESEESHDLRPANPTRDNQQPTATESHTETTSTTRHTDTIADISDIINRASSHTPSTPTAPAISHSNLTDGVTGVYDSHSATLPSYDEALSMTTVNERVLPPPPSYDELF